MRLIAIAGLALGLCGCSSELAQRPPANDPTSVAADEAPFVPPATYAPSDAGAPSDGGRPR